jgi:hypothetical protein
MDKEYDIGQLVLFNERISDTKLFPILGWIVDKSVDDTDIIRYTIEWADCFCDNHYSQVDVDLYATNFKEYARSLHK